MNKVFYNYYYRTPNYLRELQREIKKMYLTSVKGNPRGFDTAVSCFCYNLVRMVKFDYELCHVILSVSTPVPKPIVNGVLLCKPPSQANTVNLINILEELDLIYVFRGFSVDTNNKELSYFCLSEALIALVKSKVNLDRVKIKPYEDVIVLKDEDKKQVEFMKTPKTRKMITQVNNFNRVIQNHTITLDGDPVTVSFKRVFNNNSFELGGRFYTHGGEIQTVSSNKRKKIQIDGEDVAEADFKALHLNLLYEISGENVLEGFDPYNANLSKGVLVYPDELDDFVKLHDLDTSYNPVRNLAKVASLIMINATNSKEASMAIRDKVSKDDKKKGTSDDGDRSFAGVDVHSLKCDKVMDALANHNRPIDHYFNSGFGTALQYSDSEIMSGVIQDFIDADKVCIPIHDSAITKKSDISFLIESMVKNYLKVMGSKNNCFVEVKF